MSVQSSVIISTGTGGNDSNGDGVETGDQNAQVTVETIVNGEVVQSVGVSSDEQDDRTDRESRNTRRQEILDDRDRDVHVDTDIIIEDENDTGNQTNDGADGEPGADGEDGAPGNDTGRGDEDMGGDEGSDGDDGGRTRDERRERSPREVAFAVGSDVWARISSFISDVFLFWA